MLLYLLFRMILIKLKYEHLQNKIFTKALETITAPGEGKSLVESNAVKNVVTFEKEVIVDVTIGNPSLQAKKKIEVEIMKAIHDYVDQKIDVKVNVKVEVPEKEPINIIRGKQKFLESKYYCNCFRKRWCR